MSFLLLGFFTGLSLILAIGAQNIFVIEQGLKKQYVFLVCLICSLSDLILIFLGIFLFEYFRSFFTYKIELIFNILLFIFLVYFVINKIKTKYGSFNINVNKIQISKLIELVKMPKSFDRYKLEDLVKTLLDYRGDESVTLEVETEGKVVRLSMPFVTVQPSPELTSRLLEMLGADGIRTKL